MQIKKKFTTESFGTADPNLSKVNTVNATLARKAVIKVKINIDIP